MEELEYKILKSLEREGIILTNIIIIGFCFIVGFLIYAII